MGRSTTQVRLYVDNIIDIENGGTGAETATEALVNLGAASKVDLLAEKNRSITAESAIYNVINNINSTGTKTFQGGQFNTLVDKGSVAFGVVSFNFTEGNVQRLQVSGPVSLQLTGFPPNGVFGDLLIELVNGGSYTVSMPTISWIKPSDGEPAASFTEYLLDIGRDNGVLKSVGSDFLYFKTTNGGINVYGKLS